MVDGTVMMSWIRRVLWGLFLASILAFYLWTSSSSYHAPFGFQFSRDLGKPGGAYRGERAVDYYNALSDAFLAGQLHLLIEPHPALLRLSDPYNPSQNRGLRLHDAALYNGRYYLVFGPAPAIVFFIPFRCIFGMNLPQDLAIPLLAFAGLIAALLLLRLLVRRFLGGTPFLLAVAAAASMALCLPIPYLLRRPEVYETSILAGYCFLWWAFYAFVSGAGGKKFSPVRCAVGSFCFGFAVTSRADLVLLAPLLLIAVWYCRGTAGTPEAKPAARAARWAAILLPFIICMAVFAWYNYARFGRPHELGTPYQLLGNGGGIKSYEYYKLSFVPPGLYFYLFHPPLLNGVFPYLHCAFSFPWPDLLPVFYRNEVEPIAGFFTLAPSAAVLLLLPGLAPMIRRLWPGLAGIVTLFLLSGLILLFFFAYAFGAATMRYLVDFAPSLLFAAILLWLSIDALLKNRRLARAFVGLLFLLATLYGSTVNIALSFTGYGDLLRLMNPPVYQALQKFFSFPHDNA